MNRSDMKEYFRTLYETKKEETQQAHGVLKESKEDSGYIDEIVAKVLATGLIHATDRSDDITDRDIRQLQEDLVFIIRKYPGLETELHTMIDEFKNAQGYYAPEEHEDIEAIAENDALADLGRAPGPGKDEALYGNDPAYARAYDRMIANPVTDAPTPPKYDGGLRKTLFGSDDKADMSDEYRRMTLSRGRAYDK